MSLRKLLLASSAFALATVAHTNTASSSTCPPPQSYSGACIQVIVWAKDPQSGACCYYPNPCAAPDGWTIYYGPNCTNNVIELEP